YWCDEQPPDALYQEVFEHRGRWYALRAISVAAYRGAMKPRSARWRTVDLPGDVFERLSTPFAIRTSAGASPAGGRGGGARPPPPWAYAMPALRSTHAKIAVADRITAKP
ncbi:MAG: HYExAFE family protein, partial [Myxococcota bacterium]